MVVFPNCKINLGLNILHKRSDGFHDLETIFYPIRLRDALELIPSPATNDIVFTTTGLPVSGNSDDNLCVKAYRLLQHDFPRFPPVSVHLHKAIPMGAGLGGGSADAAFMLRLLNDKFQLALSDDQLIGYALQLGSDCPFFIINKPCFATGRGEKMQAIALDLSAYQFILLNPGIHVNTGWAFSKIVPAIPAKSSRDIVAQPIESWKAELKNDFEEAVFAEYPEIKRIRDELYGRGAVYAAMSGSGSTVFGIFEKRIPAALFAAKNYFVHECAG